MTYIYTLAMVQVLSLPLIFQIAWQFIKLYIELLYLELVSVIVFISSIKTVSSWFCHRHLIFFRLIIFELHVLRNVHGRVSLSYISVPGIVRRWWCLMLWCLSYNFLRFDMLCLIKYLSKTDRFSLIKSLSKTVLQNVSQLTLVLGLGKCRLSDECLLADDIRLIA